MKDTVEKLRALMELDDHIHSALNRTLETQREIIELLKAEVAMLKG